MAGLNTKAASLFKQLASIFPRDKLIALLRAIIDDTSGGAGVPFLSTSILVDAGAPGPGVRGTLQAFPTVNAALAAASAGDTLLVAPGTYPEAPSGVVTWPNVTNLTLRGMGITDSDVILPEVSYAAPANPAVAIARMTLENLTLSVLPANLALSIDGDLNTTVLGGGPNQRDGLLLKQVVVNGRTFLRRLTKVWLDNVQMISNAVALSLLGVGSFHAVRSNIVTGNASPIVLDYLGTYANEPNGGRDGYYFAGTVLTGGMTLAGAVALQIDETSEVTGLVNGNALASAVGAGPINLQPFCGLHGAFGATGLAPFTQNAAPPIGPAAPTNAVTLNFTNAPTNIAGATAAWGVDFTNGRFYGLASVTVTTLTAAQTTKVQYIQGTNSKFWNGLTLTSTNGQAFRYSMIFRACSFGDHINPGPVTVNGDIDLDVRGCSISMLDVTFSGTATVDRDVSIIPNAATVAAATLTWTTLPVPQPPYPAYVTADDFGVDAEITVKTDGPIQITGKTATAFTYASTAHTGNITFKVVRRGAP